MKLKIILSIAMLLFVTSLSYASFPVKRVTAKENYTQVNQTSQGEEILVSPAATAAQKSKGIALLLGIFLGFIAGHRWYLGSPWYWNVLFIVTAGGLGIWWIVDMIRIITGDYQPVNGTYKDEFF